MVDRMARPSAPPICWLVLTRPPASPASPIHIVDGQLGGRDERAPHPDPDQQTRAEDLGEELRIRGGEGQPHQASGQDQQRPDERGLCTDPADERRDEASDDDECACEGKLREPGGQRVIAEDGLHVDGESEEQGDHRAADQEHDNVPDGEVSVSEHL
jgi:hypothetical protein